MILSNLTGEEKLYLRRLEDLFSERRSIPAFSSFLTSRQLQIAHTYVQQREPGSQHLFWGGFPDAERQLLGVFPGRQRPDESAFPIQPVTISYRQGDTPGHRDFLGACLGLLITRESIGDIVPGAGRCTLFALDSVAAVILQELRKVGSVGVRCEPGIIGDVCVQQEFEPVRGTVPSVRIDCLVSVATGLSREKSAEPIRAERVQLDHVRVENISREFAEGSVASIRGYGKYIVEKIGTPTRKGRLPVSLKKYK